MKRRKYVISIMAFILAISSVITPIGSEKASADVVTEYPQYLQFENDHYGELISSGYKENPVLGSKSTAASTSGGWKAGTYYQYAKSIDVPISIPATEVGKYRFWVVIEPTTSVYGAGGNGVTTRTQELFAANNFGSYQSIYNKGGGQAIGAGSYSVYTGYHVYAVDGVFTGTGDSDVATGSYRDLSRINYLAGDSTNHDVTNFRYTDEHGSNYYETMKSVSYRVYRQYVGITQEPTITVSPSQDYHAGTGNTFTLAKPSYYANSYEQSNGVLQYRLNSGAWTNYTGAVSIKEEGQVGIESRLLTNGWLESNYGTAYSRQDNTPPTKPTIQLDPDKWYQSANLLISPGADSGSGVAGVDYSLSGAMNQSITRLTGLPVLAIEGITTIRALTRDNVGFGSEEISQQVKIDQTPPVGTVTAITTPAKSNIIKVKGTDALSGMLFIGLPNGSWYNGTMLDYPVTENGTYTFKFQDAAENISSQSITIDNIDIDLPHIEFSKVGFSWQDKDEIITLLYSDPIVSARYSSGVDPNKMFYKLTNSKDVPNSWEQATGLSQDVKVPEGQWYLHAKVTDLAGNTYTTVSNLYQVQYQPKVSTLSVKGIATDKISLSWNLPNVSPTATDGYTSIVKNLTTGKSWALDYPVNSLVDSDLSGGMENKYTLQVKNHVGESIVGQEVTGITLPDAPKNAQIFAVDRKFDTVRLFIPQVKSATGYKVSATNWVTGETDLVDTVSTDTYVTVSGIKANVMYDFAVQTINGAGLGGAYHTSYLSLPGNVEGFESVQIKQNSIALGWKTVTGSTYNSVTADTYYDLSRNNTTIYKGSANEYVDDRLDSGIAYDYQISAGNNTGMGEWSYLSQIHTLPAAVAQLKQTAATTTEVTIAFKSPIGATGYQVSIPGQQDMNINNSNPESIEIRSLRPGTTTLIEVKPKNQSGFGAAQTIFITTLPDAAVDGSVQVTKIGENEATFIIPEIDGATKYRLNVNNKSYQVTPGENVIRGFEGGNSYSALLAAGNISGYGKGAEVTFLTLPAIPNNLQITKHSSTSFVVVWDDVKSATKYLVRNQDGIVLGEVNKPMYQVSSVSAGSLTKIKIEAVNSTGSSKTAQVQWRTLPGIDSDDLDGLVTVDNIATDSAELHWSEVPGADSYRIYDNLGQIINETSNLDVTLTDLESAAQISNYSVVPFNTTGEAIALPAPSFVTKPSSDFLSSYSSSKKNATINLAHNLKNEVFVMALHGKMIYTGNSQIKSIPVDSLFPDSRYTFTIWTENSLGEKSKAQELEVTTSKERTTVITNEEQESPSAEQQPEEETPVVEKANDDQHKEKKSFIDIDKSFAKGSINKLADMGIIQGTTDELYEPSRGTTRAEFMSLLVRLTLTKEQISGTDQSLSFADINQDGWYIPELQAAIDYSIAKGFNEEEFKPNMLINREQAAKMIAGALYGRYAPDAQNNERSYKDKDVIADWATDEVNGLTSNQIVEGFPDDTFRPKSSLTRAEAAAMIDRAMTKGLIEVKGVNS